MRIGSGYEPVVVCFSLFVQPHMDYLLYVFGSLLHFSH
jgi:hypothetical protein